MFDCFPWLLNLWIVLNLHSYSIFVKIFDKQFTPLLFNPLILTVFTRIRASRSRSHRKIILITLILSLSPQPLSCHSDRNPSSHPHTENPSSQCNLWLPLPPLFARGTSSAIYFRVYACLSNMILKLGEIWF